MPGLVALNRRWDVGSDDFVFPGGIEILARTFWLAVVAIVFSVHQEGFEDCTNGSVVRMYYIGMMVLLTAHILVSALLCACSMRGAIIDIRRRRNVPYVLYAKVVLFLPELIWLLLGTYGAFSDSGCDKVVVVTVQALVLFGWVMFVSLLIGVVVVFDPLGHKRRKSQSLTSTTGSFYMDRNTDGSGMATKQLWETRCKLICCCASGDENSNNAFNDIAQLFTNFFEGMDLVPTDIAAGLILVQKDQQKAPQRLKRSRLILRSARSSSSPLPPPPKGRHHRVVPRHMPLPRQARSVDGEPVDPWVLREGDGPGKAGDRGQTGQSPQTSHSAVKRSVSASAADSSAVLVDMLPDEENEKGACQNSAFGAHVNSNSNGNSNDKVDSQISNISSNSHWPSSELRLRGEELDPQGWMAIHNATYFMRYAMASYGWPLYMYTNLTCGCCKLWSKCRCCCRGSTNAIVNYDNCCQCHTAAIRNLTGVEDDDIVYASFHNAIYQIPFYVALDHSRSTIIVAIRGTLSLRDALTDLTAESQDLDIPGVEAPCKAHKGIMRAATYVHGELTDKGLLETAFTLAPNYQLLITGHSLGAGAATLLSIMLRPSYPDLKCFAFSPPGGLLSHSLGEYTEEFVCSVVMGHDLVPRLGIVSMEDLKTKVLRCVKDSNKPKYKILAGGVWTALCGLPKSDEDSGRQPLLQREFAFNVPCYGTREETLSERQLEEAILMSGRSRQVNIPLYPPGKIIYIEEDSPGKTCCGESGYTASWARPEVFEEILVSPRMLTDHMPDAVFKALVQLADKNFHLREIVKVRRVESIEEGLI